MIHLLPESVSSHLRSGVAITSVAQCVEELVLNSLDAGASCVAIRLDLPCFKVQVVDNGSGIPFGELDVAGMRHYTSKCNQLSDLDNLEYFGFRGEALASICEISAIVEVVTRVKQSTKTYCKFFHNGKGRPTSEAKSQRPAAGTTITVHDLFNKLPVRKTITNHILELERVRQRLEGIALMNPQVSLSFRNDENGNKILQTTKTISTVGVFQQLFGAAKANKLTEVSCTEGMFKVFGYIGTEGHFNKNLQYVYINTRLVLKTKIHKLLNKTLKKLYSSRKKMSADATSSNYGSPSTSSPTKQANRHGIFVVNISCPFNEYDITFDPAKTLVEFKDWEAVLSVVESVIQEFQKQFSVSVSPVHAEVSNIFGACSKKAEDGTKISDTDGAILEVTGPTEISTMLTGNSLHSKFVRRSEVEIGGASITDNENYRSASPLQSKENKNKWDSDGIRSQEPMKMFPDVQDTSAYSDVSMLSSDTPSTSGSTDDHSICVAEEDPLYSPDTPPNPKTSAVLGFDANDSGIDPGVITDEIPGNLGLNTCHNPGKTFNSLFKQPQTSQLSALRHKLPGYKQQSRTITHKLKALRESLFKPVGATSENEPDTDIGQASKANSVARSLEKLKDTVAFLQDKGKHDQITTEQNDTEKGPILPLLTAKKRPMDLRQTTSSKLAKLAGLTSLGTNQRNKINTSALSFDKTCCGIVSTNPAADTLPGTRQNKASVGSSVHVPSTHCETSSSGERLGSNTNSRGVLIENLVSKFHQSTPGSSGEIMISPLQNTKTHGKFVETHPITIKKTQVQRQFLTSESLITTFSDWPKSNKTFEIKSSCKTSKTSDDEANTTPKAALVDNKAIEKTNWPIYGDGSNVSVVDDISIHHNAVPKTISSFKYQDVNPLHGISTSAVNMDDDAVYISKQKPVENLESHLKVTKCVFSSQDGEIQISHGSQILVDPQDVFKSYKCDEKLEQTPSTASFIRDEPPSCGHCNSRTCPSKTEESSLEYEHMKAYNGLSQGFDFRTMQPISSISQSNIIDHSVSENVGSCVLYSEESNNDVTSKTVSFPNNSNNINQANCDTSIDSNSPGKDLVDLLITPSPLTDTTESGNTTPCPNQPGFFEYSLGNQSLSASDNPTSDTNLKYLNETTLSPCTANSESQNIDTGKRNDGMSYDDLVGTYMQTDVPEHVAKVTAQRLKSISVDNNLKAATSTAEKDKDTVSTSLPQHTYTQTISLVIDKQNCDSGEPDVLEKTENNTEEKEIEAGDTKQTVEGTGSVDPNSGHFLTRSHPLSGKRIYIHPLTGHSLDEAGWEMWNKQHNTFVCEESADHVPKKKKKLLSHDLMSKPSASCSGCTESDKITETQDKTALNDLWAHHVTDQTEGDSVKWRNPIAKEDSIAVSEASDSLTDLFEEWDNPVFSLPDEDITSAELLSRRAVKIQKAVQPCRFTKNMLTQTQVLGQVDDKFIACLMRTNDKNLSADSNLLVLVDQHAAHERVRLEQLTKDSFIINEKEDVRILKRSEVIPPAELKLAEDIVRVITAYKDKFHSLGVEFSTTDRRDTVLIKSAPSCFMEREANERKRGRSSVVMEMIEGFINEQVELLKTTHGAMNTIPPAVHKLLCSQACHGAIKFGDSLNVDECEDLVDSLSVCELPFQCAHGRPSVMPILDLDTFRTKFPPRSLGKPKLWKLREKVEENMLEETLDL